MESRINIGKAEDNDIVIKDKKCPDLLAVIIHDKGNWTLINLVVDTPTFVNNNLVEKPTILEKNDRIKAYSQTIYWNNYLYEGENQELYLKDIFSYNGRISRSNFRVLTLLAIGQIICVLILPGLLGSIAVGRRVNYELFEKITEISMPIVYLIGFSFIGITMLILAIKRIRDTGKPLWTLLIPIYNLKILYYDLSQK